MTTGVVDGIDTSIDADERETHFAADWLIQLRDGFANAESTMLESAPHRAEFSGKFSDAADSYAQGITKICSGAQEELEPCINTIREWGYRITRSKEAMASCRDRARSGGLTVSGEVIEPPAPVNAPSPLPDGATTQDVAAWNKNNADYNSYLAQAALFDELQQEATAIRQADDSWVNDFMGSIASFDWKSLFRDLFLEVGVPLLYGDHAFRQIAKDVNNGSRSLKSLPYRSTEMWWLEKVDPTKIARTGRRVFLKVLDAGNVISWATGAWDFLNGESATKIGLTLAAGTVTAASLPATAPVVVVLGLSAAVSWGVGQAYDRLPEPVRDVLDEAAKPGTGFRLLGEAQDKAGDAVDTVLDVAGNGADAIGDKAEDMFDHAASGFKPDSFPRKILEGTGDVVDGTLNAADTVMDKAGDVVDNVSDFSAGALKKVGNGLNSAVDKARDLGSGAVNWVKDKLPW